MIKLTKILYPTDFSELSLLACKYAKSFAQQYNAELHCIHVLDESFQYWLAMSPDGVPIGPNLTEIMEIHQKEMADLASKEFADIPNVVTKVITGKPFIEIIRYAREQTIDMIIIPTHGKSAFKQVLMGSVAERVVRKAPCPVLTVRAGEHEFILP